MGHEHGPPTEEGRSQQITVFVLDILVWHVPFLPGGPIEWVPALDLLVLGCLRDNHLIILVQVLLRHAPWLVCVVWFI